MSAGSAAIYTTYRSALFSSVCLCKPAIKRIYKRAQETALDKTDLEDLKGRKFQFLWWASYLTAPKH